MFASDTITVSFVGFSYILSTEAKISPTHKSMTVLASVDKMPQAKTTNVLVPLALALGATSGIVAVCKSQ